MIDENMYEKYDNRFEDITKAQSGDSEALEKLIEDNQGLLWSIVKRFSGRGYELEDLYQIASLGFIKCIKKFDTNFEVRLSTYAVPYILGEIKRYIQEDGPIKVSRALKELNSKIAFVQKEYLRKTGQDMSIEEIAKECGVSKEEVTMALESKNPVSSLYDSSSNNDEEGISIIEKIATNVDEQSAITNKIVITQLIENLPEREKQVILLRYYRGKTQSEIAKLLGTSQVQISRIEKKVLQEMKMKLSEDLVLK